MTKDDDSSGYTGKRRKSFREMDAARGKSKYHSRQDDPAQQRIERSASYEKYKKAADAIFTGGALPVGLAGKFDPEGAREKQKAALAAISLASDRQTWAKLVEEFVETFPLPDDAYFLDSILGHPKDALAEKALTHLEDMSASGKLVTAKLPRSLEQRLRTVEMTSLDPEVAERARVLRSKVT